MAPTALFFEPVAPRTAPARPEEIEIPDTVTAPPAAGLPLDDAMKRALEEAIAVMAPPESRKVEGKRAIAGKLHELGYTNWPDFVARGRKDFPAVLEVARAWDRSKAQAGS